MVLSGYSTSGGRPSTSNSAGGPGPLQAGDHVPDTPFAVHGRQDVLEQMTSELFPISVAPDPSKRYVPEDLTLSDDQLIERA